ncbi:MAG: hypothetical protein K2X53_02065 [Alphaproteobacteria bacterium]|nr:hypothetical protein [Alphaproteobacteria bacterium]
MLAISNIPPVWQQVCKNTAYYIGGASVVSFALNKMGRSDLARISLIFSIGLANLNQLNTLNTYYYRENPRRMILNDAVGRFLNIAITLFAIDIFAKGNPKVTLLVLIAAAIFIKIKYNKALNLIIYMENRAAERLASLDSSSQKPSQDQK